MRAHSAASDVPRGTAASRSIELMVALVLAGILLLGLSVFFVSSSRSFSEAERVSRQIENGRYAMALLAEEIRHAGFYGQVGNVTLLPTVPTPSSPIPLPATLPDPCATAIANVKAALSIPIQGVDNVPRHLAELRPRRRGRHRHPGHTPREHDDDRCRQRSRQRLLHAKHRTAPRPRPIFMIAQSGFTLTDKDCATVMPIRQYHVYIYYIAPCSVATGAGGACQAGDPPLPTLKRVELLPRAMSTPVPLVEGIENIQYEYGLDTSANPDGSPDTFTAGPASVTQWSQVVAIRVHLLARNVDATPGFTDTKTYAMGN